MDEADIKAWVRVIGGRLREARQAAGLSVRDAVALAGVSLSSIQRSESGTTDVCVVMLAKLCSAYGIEPASVIPPLPDRPPPPADPPKPRRKPQ